MKASQKSSQRSFIQHDYEVPRQLWAMEELYRELEIENPELRNNPYYVRLRRSFREFSDPHERTPRISISSSLLGSLKCLFYSEAADTALLWYGMLGSPQLYEGPGHHPVCRIHYPRWSRLRYCHQRWCKLHTAQNSEVQPAAPSRAL